MSLLWETPWQTTIPGLGQLSPSLLCSCRISCLSPQLSVYTGECLRLCPGFSSISCNLSLDSKFLIHRDHALSFFFLGHWPWMQWVLNKCWLMNKGAGVDVTAHCEWFFFSPLTGHGTLGVYRLTAMTQWRVIIWLVRNWWPFKEGVTLGKSEVVLQNSVF